MQNKFGKKLEESRTRKGISIRQASDDLKIRPDFLLSMENDNGNFSMPYVYKMGFIKLYAKYLKLDPIEIANDFNAYHNFDIKNKQKEDRELLGRIELITPEPIAPIQNALNFDEGKSDDESDDVSFNKQPTIYNKAFYIKYGLILTGGVAALWLVTVFFSNIFSAPKINESSSNAAFERQVAAKGKHAIEELILTGEDNIHVVVRQEGDKQRLFSGNIDKTHPVTISRQGPVKIHFSDGSKLSIQKPDGKKINPGREGMGWIEL